MWQENQLYKSTIYSVYLYNCSSKIKLNIQTVHGFTLFLDKYELQQRVCYRGLFISLLLHQQPTGSLVPILACSAHGNATKWRGLYDYRFPHPRACLKPADPHEKLVYLLLVAFCIFSFVYDWQKAKGRREQMYITFGFWRSSTSLNVVKQRTVGRLFRQRHLELQLFKPLGQGWLGVFVDPFPRLGFAQTRMRSIRKLK